MIEFLVTIFILIPTLASAELPSWVEKGLDQNGMYQQEVLIMAIRYGFKDLEGAYLKEANLSGANLENVNFENTNLQHAILTDTNLTGANFKEAIFNNTNFTRANLQNAQFNISSLKMGMNPSLKMKRIVPSCILVGLDKNGVYQQELLIKALKNNETDDFTGAYLNGADLKGIHSKEIIFNAANLSNADLSGANLKKIDLRYANLTRANFKGANLEGANLNNATVIETNFKGANLESAQLTQVNFEGANFTEVNLKRVNLSFSNLQKANLTNANFEGANLRGVNFSFSNIEKTNFTNAILEGANFSGILKKINKASSRQLIDIYKYEVMSRINQNWELSYQRLGGSETKLSAILIIRIKKNGYIQPDMWFEKKSGNEYFDESIIKAVKKANPLPPLPDAYQRPFFEVGLNFSPSGMKK